MSEMQQALLALFSLLLPAAVAWWLTRSGRRRDRHRRSAQSQVRKR